MFVVYKASNEVQQYTCTILVYLGSLSIEVESLIAEFFFSVTHITCCLIMFTVVMRGLGIEKRISSH